MWRAGGEQALRRTTMGKTWEKENHHPSSWRLPGQHTLLHAGSGRDKPRERSSLMPVQRALLGAPAATVNVWDRLEHKTGAPVSLSRVSCPGPGSAAATHDPRGKTPGATIRAWAREQALPRFLQTDVIPLNRRFLRQLSSWVFYARANILVKSHHSLLRLDTPLGMVSGQNCDCKNMSIFTLTLGGATALFSLSPFHSSRLSLTSPPSPSTLLFCTPPPAPGARHIPHPEHPPSPPCHF